MNSKPTLLACDLDGTLIPPPGVTGSTGLAEFSALRRTSRELLLAYVTGRHYQLALEGITDHGLPRPDVLVCDVGTSAYRWRGTGFELDESYRSLMQEAASGNTAARVREALVDVEGLRLQEDEKQAEFKASYYWGIERAERPEMAADYSVTEDTVRKDVKTRLADIGASFSVVVSVDPVTGVGLLDVLPAGVAKDFAVRHLAGRSGCDPDRVVYAGDSGNDSAAMLSGCRSIVVGNAPEDFRTELRRRADEKGVDDRLYFAKGFFAAGVMEGCRHFGVV